MDPAEPIWATIAARMGSSRLPGKSMAELAGKPSLRHIIDRLRTIDRLAGVVVATTDRPEDEVIVRCAEDAGIPVYAGSSDDVLGRTLSAARSVGARTIVQITGDCPMIDPRITARVLEAYLRERPDYASNVLTEELTYPAGFSTEVFSVALLEEVERSTQDPADREHVSTFIYHRPERYRLLSVEAEGDERRPDLWLSLDTPEDLEGIRAIFDELYAEQPLFGFRETLALLERRPELAELNRSNGRR